MREVNSQKLLALYQSYEVGMYQVAYDILGDCLLAEQAVNKSFETIIPQLHKIKEVYHARSQEFVFEAIVDTATGMVRELQREIWLFEFVDEDNQEMVHKRKERFMNRSGKPLFSEQYQKDKHKLIEKIGIGERKRQSILERIIIRFV